MRKAVHTPDTLFQVRHVWTANGSFLDQYIQVPYSQDIRVSGTS
jgi:hypothetical protein